MIDKFDKSRNSLVDTTVPSSDYNNYLQSGKRLFDRMTVKNGGGGGGHGALGIFVTEATSNGGGAQSKTFQ